MRSLICVVFTIALVSSSWASAARASVTMVGRAPPNLQVRCTLHKLASVFGVGIFAAGAPDVPFASENDKPAAPNTGRALLLCFRFEVCFTCDMADSYTFGQCSDQSIATAIRKTVLGSIGRCLSRRHGFRQVASRQDARPGRTDGAL